MIIASHTSQSTRPNSATARFCPDYITVSKVAEEIPAYMEPELLQATLKELEKKMVAAAKKLDFEEAARLRDKIKALKKSELDLLEGLE